MVVRAAAVCPQAPGLVPAVGVGIAEELADLRASCLAALAAVIGSEPDRVVVLGDGGQNWDESAGGSFRGFGPNLHAGGANLVLPPGLTVGAWLLDAAGWAGPRTYASDLSRVDAAEDVALLIMADGSARHRMLAPEWADVEGRAFDAVVAKALEVGDADALAALDVDAAVEFHASGIGGLAQLGETCKGARIAARLRYDGAPFDVGYWVAEWSLGG